MKSDPLVDAIGEIRDGFVQDAEAPRRAICLRKVRRRLLTVALAAALLIGTASAEISAGTVSNLLAPLYGGAQTEIVDSIGIPVNASTTVEGYTLTADAVIGDRYNIAIVYTLTREDRAPMPKGVMFADQANSVCRGSGGGSISYERSEDGMSLQIVEEWTSSDVPLLRRNAKVVFENLEVYDKESRERSVLVEGTWELNFTVRYKDATVKVPVDDLHVTGTEGYEYQIHEVFLSPLGVHMELTAPNTLDKEDPHSHLMPDFVVSVLLNDDTAVEMTGANRGGGGDVDEERLDAHYGAAFQEPIPLDTIAGLIICDQTFPVEITE